METPKVTLLMSTYNRPDYLKEAITSVLGQSMDNWELILMNDGGVDVGPIVEEFRDQRIKYLNDAVNRGKAFRMNQGLNLAKGEYIAYLDDDDRFYPNHFQALSSALDQGPQYGAAYSDLYCVQFIKDEASGKRYPVNKFIQVSRDYNRDMMFHFNHTLHVSLMHRKDLALKAGGYDANVTVLIDWNITRKLSFYTDFKYVPDVTGEYYIPITNSDRISNLERKDPERFKHNLRKIKANLPPEPWAKVERVGIVMPVSEWDVKTRERLADFIDHIDYPIRWALVNNSSPAAAPSKCSEVLGELSELSNVRIFTPPRPLSAVEAYRFGTGKLNVDFVYLPTEKAVTNTPFRLIKAIPFLDKMGKSCLKWPIPQEKETQFDLIIRKKHFLNATKHNKNGKSVNVSFLNGTIPNTLKADILYNRTNEHIKKEDYQEAFKTLKELEGFSEGAPTGRTFVDMYVKVCSALKYYDLAEAKCRQLIEEGCGGQNWILLGKILQSQKAYPQAVEAYRNAIKDLDLDISDLLNPAFRHILPEQFGIVAASLGLGECLVETGNLVEASQVFRRAARVKPDSPKPFLGFARLFIKTGDLPKARQAISDIMARGKENSETYLLLGHIEETEKKIEAAFEAYKKAISLDPKDPEIQTSLYNTGKALGRWQETLELLESALEKCPDSVHCINLTASAAHEAGADGKASELLKQGLVIMPEHNLMAELLERGSKTIEKSEKTEIKPGQSNDQIEEPSVRSLSKNKKKPATASNDAPQIQLSSAPFRGLHPLVSVGLPVYNGGKYLSEAIESILSQDFSEFELIISDNCSSDNTLDICSEFARNDSRIRYFRFSSNLGATRNFLNVLGLAIAPYFMWASHDDLHEKSFISKCLEPLQKDPSISLAYPQTRLLKSDSSQLGIAPETVIADQHDPITRFCNIIWKIGLCNMFYGIYRTEQLKKLSSWSYTVFAQDNLVLSEVALTGRIIMVQEPLFVRRFTRDYNYDSPDARYCQLFSETTPGFLAEGISLPYSKLARAHIDLIQHFNSTAKHRDFLTTEIIKCFRRRYGQLLQYEIDRLIHLISNGVYYKTWEKSNTNVKKFQSASSFGRYQISNLLNTMKDAVLLFPERKDLVTCYKKCLDEIAIPDRLGGLSVMLQPCVQPTINMNA